MKNTIKAKLTTLSERYDALAQQMCDPELVSNNEQFQKVTREYNQLELVVAAYKRYQETELGIADAEEMLNEGDVDLADMAKDELSMLQNRQAELMGELERLLLPTDPDDHRNVFIEIRAGTGGDEAALFSGDLQRMYSRYAERQGWRIEIANASQGEKGGFKEVILKVEGHDVYSQLKFESGAHRVQRVPETETQGRIHTSACTVAILPDIESIDEVEVNPADLRVDTYRASGAGGQHVNKTDSAVRITHLPTGVVVECQDERSQHKNRARAMSILGARLLAAEREKQRSEQAQTRRQLVGSGDRSERIRTYNYPQGRITDHRINLTLYKLEEVVSGGSLEQVIEPLILEHQADLLAHMQEQG